MMIKKRRASAYKFLKYYRLKATGRGKVFIFDIASVPKDISTEEFLEKWKKEQRNNCYQIVNSK